MQTVKDFDTARRILSSRDEFGPPSMYDYIVLLEKEAEVDFSALKKYMVTFLPFMHGEPHLRIRKLINRRFARSEMKKWNSTIVSIIEQRLAKINTGQPYDLIVDIVDPLYIDFVEMLFGIQVPDRKHFISQIEIATNSVERMSSLSQLRKLQKTLLELDELVSKQIDAVNPQLTLFNDIAHSVEGQLNADELITILLVLLIAPRATTETLAHIIVAFSQLDATKLAKYSSADFVDQHINDLIRLYASTNMLSKEAKTHVSVNQCPVAAGVQVLVDIPCVNRDPNIYQDQTSLDALHGNSNERKHLTFGAGAHICIGAEFAKEIIREAIPRIFAAFPSVTCHMSEVTYYNAQIATRIKTLPVEFQ